MSIHAHQGVLQEKMGSLKARIASKYFLQWSYFHRLGVIGTLYQLLLLNDRIKGITHISNQFQTFVPIFQTSFSIPFLQFPFSDYVFHENFHWDLANSLFISLWLVYAWVTPGVCTSFPVLFSSLVTGGERERGGDGDFAWRLSLNTNQSCWILCLYLSGNTAIVVEWLCKALGQLPCIYVNCIWYWAFSANSDTC